MNKAIRRLAVGAALAAFTLTGCASWPGTGVRVGATRISDDAIVRASVAIQDIRGAGDADATEVLQTAASGFALGEAARQIAAQNNIEVTTAAKQSAVTVSPALFASPDVGPLIDGIATNAVVASKLGQNAYLDQLSRIQIEVNPRYGNWSASQAALTSSALSTSLEALQANR